MGREEGEGELKYEKQLFIPKIHTSWLHISQYMAVNGTAVQVFSVTAFRTLSEHKTSHSRAVRSNSYVHVTRVAYLMSVVARPGTSQCTAIFL